jgi:hypothetical protein
MPQPSLVKECETFRETVMLGINNLDISEAQKQVFLLSHQSFYMQLLQQLCQQNNTTAEDSHALAEIVN